MVLPMLVREEIEPINQLLLDMTDSHLKDIEISNLRTLKS